MKLFDILGGKVIIHSDALGIPCFKKIWDADKADKEHATKVISYIVLKNKWDSPYVLSMNSDSIETKLKEELFNLRFQLAVNQLENSSRIVAVKKDIARISTVLRQMELNGAEA